MAEGMQVLNFQYPCQSLLFWVLLIIINGNGNQIHILCTYLPNYEHSLKSNTQYISDHYWLFQLLTTKFFWSNCIKKQTFSASILVVITHLCTHVWETHMASVYRNHLNAIESWDPINTK